MKKTIFLLGVIFCSKYSFSQTKSIQPFTGAMIIENGIKYEKLEIKIKDNLLLTPDIPQGEELVFRITKPWSFITDKKGNVHPGIGFKIADKTGKIISSIENIYKKDVQGINSNYLSALSFTITLDNKQKINDSITIYAKFFDTINKDSLLIILPCKVVAKGKAQSLDSWNSFSSTFGATGMFVKCKAEEFDFKKTFSKKETQTSIDTMKLSIKSLGGFVEKDGKVYLVANYFLYDKNFTLKETKPLFANAENGLRNSQLQNITQLFVLPAGMNSGMARIIISDKNGLGKLDAVYNFVY